MSHLNCVAVVCISALIIATEGYGLLHTANVKTLQVNYEAMQRQLGQLVNAVEILQKSSERQEKEIRQLEELVTRLEGQIPGNGRVNSPNEQRPSIEHAENFPALQKEQGKSLIGRSCLEIRFSNPDAPSDMYWIDPDGTGVGETPIYVKCDMTIGTTEILFDSKSDTEVSGCNGPGCFSKPVSYNAEMKQIESLIELSSECSQSIQYTCIEAPFHLSGSPYSWWKDRNGNQQYYWTGSNSNAPTCQCGTSGTCISPSVLCNCDALSVTAQLDTGVITNKSALPITELNFGLRASSSALGIYTLGPLTCSGRSQVDGMPTSCRDLWVIGHSFSGFYSIKAADSIQTVYCDFNQRLSSPGLQNVIGTPDIKSTSVYFYVQRSTSRLDSGTIPFDLERVNIGGGMDLNTGVFTAPVAGYYFFSFDGMKRIDETTALHLHLSLNGVSVETTYAPISSVYQHFSLSSNLHLLTGDRVELVLDDGGLYDNSDHYGGFTGMLLQQDASL